MFMIGDMFIIFYDYYHDDMVLCYIF